MGQARSSPAIRAVEQWFDGPGAGYWLRVPPGPGEAAAWRKPADGVWPELRVGIPFEYPAKPPNVRVPSELCLERPHVEFEGDLCHGIDARTDALAYVRDVLQQANYLFHKSEQPAWREAEFHRERISYWSRFCRKQHKRQGALRALSLRIVDLPDDGDVADVLVGTGKGYTKRARHGRAFVGKDCKSLDAFVGRHVSGIGQISYGSALFVGAPAGTLWTPSTWPNDSDELLARIYEYGFDEHLRRWISSPDRKKDKVLFIVFRVERTYFAYQLFALPTSRFAQLPIEPVHVERRDVRWCLSRDHEAATLDARLKKRVVVLGCGSLGSHLAGHLARAGIGRIDLLDEQLFESENIARHLVGMGGVGQSKAVALAARLRYEVPGIQVEAHASDAVDWLSTQDLSDVALVVDATGERSVRLAVRKYAAGIPVALVWAEPFCAAGHAVVLLDAAMWPEDDPADELVNAYLWPGETKVQMPACGAGFSPYADADIAQVASFCAEKVLVALDAAEVESRVWSQVREAPAAAVAAKAQLRRPLPDGLTLAQYSREWSNVIR